MAQATTLGSRPRRFSYYGDMKKGYVINYDYGKLRLDASFFSRILKTFSGKTVLGGFSLRAPAEKGFGVWVKNNSQYNSDNLSLRHAARIAAVLVAEGYASSNIRNNTVYITFYDEADADFF
jgi:hypothetical protein